MQAKEKCTQQKRHVLESFGFKIILGTPFKCARYSRGMKGT